MGENEKSLIIELEKLTLKLIEYVERKTAVNSGNIDGELIREIRENVNFLKMVSRKK